MEQLGFTIGSKLHIRLRNGELVVSVFDEDEQDMEASDPR
ncbi:hypothetical protein [Xanthomonas sp. WHRI 10064B]|nr:hypothetical protein [Xanthomonas sp. WHRI 10064B]MEA9589712.1 hypothetical protein [Xanthomonas sp. WHRI 10064B]